MKQINQIIGFFYFVIFLSCQINAQTISSNSYQDLLAEHFDENGPGASVLVAKNGKIIYKDAIGKANLELNVPMNADHIFRIGSITKQFTAVAILKLMEQGKIDLQDDITKYILDYPTNDKHISIEHLLTHTSGIQSMTGMPTFMADSRNDKSTSEMIDYFKNEPMNFEPGEEFLYNNSGYYLLGVIIENISGMSYADYIQKEIFDVAGMENSYYGSFQKIIPNRASGYQRDGDDYVNASYISMTLPYAAGSLLSTVEDWYKWNKALWGGKIIQKKTLDLAHQPYQLNNGEMSDYGYGWGVGNLFGNRNISHGGGINGFLTEGIYFPDEDLMVTIFSNCNCQPPGFVASKIAAIEIGAYEERKTIAVDQATLVDYQGVYKIEGSEDKRSIVVKDNYLTSQRAGRDLLEIFPFEKDKFYFKNSLTLFEFVRNANGMVEKMISYRPDGTTDHALKTDEKPLVRKAISLPEKILSRYIGEYELMPGFNIVVTVQDGALMGQPSGQGNYELFAEDETHFFLKVVDAQVIFKKGEDDTYSILQLNQGGQELVGKRVK